MTDEKHIPIEILVHIYNDRCRGHGSNEVNSELIIVKGVNIIAKRGKYCLTIDTATIFLAMRLVG